MTKNQKIYLALGLGLLSAGLILAPKMLKSKPPAGNTYNNTGGENTYNPGGVNTPGGANTNPGGGNNPNPDTEFAQWVKKFIEFLRTENVRETASDLIESLVKSKHLTNAQGSGVKYSVLYILLDMSKAYGEKMNDYSVIYNMIPEYNEDITKAITAFSIQKYSNLKPSLLPSNVAENAISQLK